MSSIVILTGSPGAGKTTVGARLAKDKVRGVHIPSDVFYTFPAHPISPYRPAALEQNTDIIAAAARTSAAFAARGYHVILDGMLWTRERVMPTPWWPSLDRRSTAASSLWTFPKWCKALLAGDELSTTGDTEATENRFVRLNAPCPQCPPWWLV